MMLMPLAATVAHLAPEADRATELCAGPHLFVADHPTSGQPSTGPAPLDLMTGALAACSAMSVRSFLERDGDPGDIHVTVTLDAGPPTMLYRRVVLTRVLDEQESHRLADVLERTEVTMMLRPAFQIRTLVESDGGSGPS